MLVNCISQGMSMDQEKRKRKNSASGRKRKPYTISKPRETWTDEEHDRFIQGLDLYDRDWKRIEDHVGSKTVIQIRSHAQKYFLKMQKQGRSHCIPPPRPKRKASRPYPRSSSTASSPPTSPSPSPSPALYGQSASNPVRAMAIPVTASSLGYGAQKWNTDVSIPVPNLTISEEGDAFNKPLGIPHLMGESSSSIHPREVSWTGTPTQVEDCFHEIRKDYSVGETPHMSGTGRFEEFLYFPSGSLPSSPGAKDSKTGRRARSEGTHHLSLETTSNEHDLPSPWDYHDDTLDTLRFTQM